MSFTEAWLRKTIAEMVDDLLNERNLTTKYTSWELIRAGGLIESSKCALFGELYGMICTNLDWMRMSKGIKMTEELAELETKLILEHSYKIKSQINLIADK